MFPSVRKLLVPILVAFHMQGCIAGDVGEAGYGLIGYGISMYQPLCAYSCRVVLSGSALSCSTMGTEGGLPMPRTTPGCFATDEAFLTSMALCLQSRCTGLPAWEVEKYWQKTEAGVRNSHRRLDEPGVHVVTKPPIPKWTYQQALSQIQGNITSVLAYSAPLNQTSLVGDTQYQLQYDTMEMFERMETHHEKYGLVLIALGAVVPIASSWLRFLPLPRLLKAKIRAALVDPPLLGRRHKAPYFKMIMMPTRSQAILIAFVVVINIVLSGVDIQSAQPNAWWWDNQLREVLTSVANRTGVLSFANVPLLILYAGRNNFLYWLTDWTQSTFMTLHRWTAYMCTLQAIVHSVLWLHIYVVLGWHESEARLPYWIWGIVATLAMSLLLPASVIPFRARMYEMFFFWHLVLAVFSVVGCYLHIVYRFHHQWGYEAWMYIALGVWGFDRIARLVRMARNGWRQAAVTVIDDEYVQVDIEDAEGRGHAYLYFPTLTWRIWESHPFSIMGARVKSRDPPPSSFGSLSEKSRSTTSKLSSTSAADVVIIHEPPRVGLSFLIRTFGGATGMLRHRNRLPVLVEAGYLPYPDLTGYQTLICIVGGVAITAVAPALRAYPGHAKLYWSCRSSELVESVDLGHIDTDILVGERIKLRHVLEEEVAKAKGDTAVVVGGPAAMTDEVRCIVSELALKAPIPVTLIDETYYW